MYVTMTDQDRESFYVCQLLDDEATWLLDNEDRLELSKRVATRRPRPPIKPAELDDETPFRGDPGWNRDASAGAFSRHDWGRYRLFRASLSAYLAIPSMRT